MAFRLVKHVKGLDGKIRPHYDQEFAWFFEALDAFNSTHTDNKLVRVTVVRAENGREVMRKGWY